MSKQAKHNDRYSAITLNGKRYECWEVEGDGACFYNSLCKDTHFSTYKPHELRQEYLQRLKHVYLMDNRIQEVWKGIHQTDITTYCADHAVSTSRGSEKEAVLISYMFDVNIRFAVSEINGDTDYEVNFISENLMDRLKLPKQDGTVRETITLLFHPYKSPNSPCSHEERNHFLYLNSVCTEKEIVKAKRKSDVIDMFKDNSDDDTIIDVYESCDTIKEELEVDSYAPSRTTTTTQKVKLSTGRKHKSRKIKEWYRHAETYHRLKQENEKMTQMEFLSDNSSGPLSLDDRSVFSRWYKRYLDGELESVGSNTKRISKLNLRVVDEAVVAYIQSKPISLGGSTKGRHPTWKELKSVTEKALKKVTPKHRDRSNTITASVGFISNVLKRNEVNLGSGSS